MEIVLENSCTFAKAEGLSSGETPRAEGTECDSAFPQSSEGRLPPNKSCLLGDTICPVPSVTGCCARRLNSDPSACTKRTCCRAGRVGRIQLASPGLHQQGQAHHRPPGSPQGWRLGLPTQKLPGGLQLSRQSHPGRHGPRSMSPVECSL